MPVFYSQQKFTLESGVVLPAFHLEYQTFGQLNDDGSNVAWVFHALTANSNPLEWWDGLVGYQQLISPDQYYIICVNMPGSCYGSIGPLSTNPEQGEPYFHQFPLVTTRDMAHMYDLLREELGINKIQVSIGGSMGGMQALEWAALRPNLFTNLVLIATNAKHSPWGIAFNATQRMAIETDVTWPQRHSQAGRRGLQTARAIAMLSYRNYHPFWQSQRDEDAEKTDQFKASSYQYYQGEKLANRFDAFSYYALTKSMDAHNMGRGRKSIQAALALIKARTLVIGIESDLLFPIEEQLFLWQHIPGALLKLIDSPYGHDGFLIEYEQLNQVIGDFLQTQQQRNTKHTINK